MRIFTSSTVTWWQVGILKLSVLSIGVAIGAAWPAVFSPYTAVLVGVGVVLGLYVGYVWMKKS
jgi:hypothetical protein